MKTLRLLIDADMLLYAVCASCEREIDWGDDLFTLHVDLSEAKAKLIDKLTYIIGRTCTLFPSAEDVRYQLLCCLSDSENFRKTISPTYKLNRAKKRKPIGYAALATWLKDALPTKTVCNLEADDIIGILATCPHPANTTPIIISGDKDLKGIPGAHYNFLKDEMTFIEEEEAYRNFLTQVLTGDAADGYSGCPGVGVKTAERLLSKNPTWRTVVLAYEKHGLSEADAFREALLARILHYTDYDHKKGEVILWTPPKDASPKPNSTSS